MKLLDRLAPVAESLSLACLGAGLLWLSLSGRYASFVPPSARLGIIVSGAGLLVRLLYPLGLGRASTSTPTVSTVVAH